MAVKDYDMRDKMLSAQADVQQRFRSLGTEAVSSTPEAFARLIATEVASFTRLARAGNIRAD